MSVLFSTVKLLLEEGSDLSLMLGDSQLAGTHNNLMKEQIHRFHFMSEEIDTY